MVDVGIKKIQITESSLPAIRDTEEYLLRYRVKTNTNSSTWSKVYVVGKSNSIASLVAIEPINPSISQIDNNNKLQVSWTMPNSINLNYFDVYVKWYYTTEIPNNNTQNATEWVRYDKVVYLSTINIDIPSTAKWFQIAVTAETFPKFVNQTILSDKTTFLFQTESGANLRRRTQTIDGGGTVGGTAAGGNTG